MSRCLVVSLLLLSTFLSTGAVEVCPLDDACRQPVVGVARGDTPASMGTATTPAGGSEEVVPDCECCCAQIVGTPYVSFPATAGRAETLVLPATIRTDVSGMRAFRPPRGRA